MSNSKKLSVSKIKKLLSLFKFIVSQKSNDKAACLAFLNENSVDDISESIYNILYNEKLISNQNCKTSLNMRKCFAKNIHPVARACCSIDQTRSEIHFEWGKPLKI